MVLPEDVRNAVDRIVEKVNPDTIVLFGSRARGDARKESDIDLLIIESEPFGGGRSRLAEIGVIHRALFGLPASVDILLFSKAEVERLKNAPNHVVARALAEGSVVYDRS